uniref:Uncharacterized protein n=2 Tax=Parascaris univalens TaxID=6257 RepID=A0A914ZX48_PARUN
CTLLFLHAFTVLTKSKALVRVESGHQIISVEEREPYEGHYTRLTFSRPRCIESLNVDCLVPLTGAEDVEIVYSPCLNDSIWRLAHYSNSGSNFVLRTPIWARRISVISRQSLTVVDVSVQPCNFPNRTAHPLSKAKCHDKNITRTNFVAHKHRKHRHGKISIVEDVTRRRKRDIVEANRQHFSKSGSPYRITENITIESGHSVIIEPGVSIQFTNDTGIIVFGSLYIGGTKGEPVLLSALNDSTWKGVIFRLNNVSASAVQSQLTYVNISGSEEGVLIEGPPFPHMDHVVSEANSRGITLRIYDSKVNTTQFMLHSSINTL